MERTGPSINHAFAAWAKRVVGDRSTREVYRLTGVSHTSISNILFGIVPSYRLLERFCVGLSLPEEDTEEGFRLAGYGAGAPTGLPEGMDEEERIRRIAEETAAAMLRLQREAGDDPTYRPHGPPSSGTKVPQRNEGEHSSQSETDYEPDLEEIDLACFKGVESLSLEDRKALEVLIREFIRETRDQPVMKKR